MISAIAPRLAVRWHFKHGQGVHRDITFMPRSPTPKTYLVTYHGTVNDQPGWNPPVYYNINYREYDESATVTSYSRTSPIIYGSKLAATNQALANPSVAGSVTATYLHSDRQLVAGQSLTQELSGSGAIRRLKVKFDGARSGSRAS